MHFQAGFGPQSLLLSVLGGCELAGYARIVPSGLAFVERQAGEFNHAGCLAT